MCRGFPNPQTTGNSGRRWRLLPPADWEIGDTAGLETCAKVFLKRKPHPDSDKDGLP